MAVKATQPTIFRTAADATNRVQASTPRFGRRVATGAGDDRDPARRVIDRRLDQAAMLVDADGGRLARRADDDDARGAVIDLKVDQPRERREVERAALLHRRDDRDETS